MLKVSNLTFSYNRNKPVLHNFSMELKSGGVYGLLGPNGAGKTTLLQLIAGTLTPQKGIVTYNGIDTRRRLPATISDLFMVAEEFSLPNISLRDFVNLNAPFYPRFSQDDLNRNLRTFSMECDAVPLGTLSMGQKKKVFLSFALACNTSLLLLDEPTNGLDIPGKRAFRRFIASGMTDNRIIVISTHQVRDIDRLLDHIVIMNDKQLVLNRSICEIQDHLQFTVTSDTDAVARALASMPGVGGNAVMFSASDECTPTEINLELLFDFAIDNPGRLADIFNAPQKTE